MAKIARKTQLIFGSNALTNQIAQFGSLAATAPAFTTDPAVIQALSQYLSGWFAGVILGNSPAIEDMNAICYLYAYQLAYIMQSGVPEWDAGTTYYIGSFVSDGAGSIYASLTDNNLNNALTSTANWRAGMPLPQFNMRVGNSLGTGVNVDTSLIGDIKAQTRVQTATVTIAVPGVFTSNGHGLTAGDRFYLTTTGALPTGYTASTTYYASNVTANTFTGSTTFANAIANTAITTTGTQSGVHTLLMGGLQLPGTFNQPVIFASTPQFSAFKPDSSHTLTAPVATDTLMVLATAQSPTNKTYDSTSTMTGVRIASFTPDGTHTLTAPAVTDTLAVLAAAQTFTNKSMDGASNTFANLPASALTGTVSPTKGGTGVANNAASTVTISGNFALTLTLSNTTSVTLPTAGTLATLAGSETFTNKVLTGNTAVNLISGSGTLTLNTTGTITIPNATDTLVGKATTDVLTNKTLTTPLITTGGSIDVTAAGTLAIGASMGNNALNLGGSTTPINFSGAGSNGSVTTGGQWTLGAALSAGLLTHNFNIQSNAGAQSRIRMTAPNGASLPEVIVDAGSVSAIALNADGANNICALNYVSELRFYTNTYANVAAGSLYGTERFRLATNLATLTASVASGTGPALLLTNSSNSSNFQIAAGSSNTSAVISSSTDNISINTQVGECIRAATNGSVRFAAIGTTGSAANAFLDGAASNNLARSTSSIRYKTNVKDLPIDMADKLLAIRPVTYTSKCPNDDKKKVFVGVIAEEVYDLIPEVVFLNKDGKPDGVMYDRLVPIMISEIKRLRADVDRLKK